MSNNLQNQSLNQNSNKSFKFLKDFKLLLIGIASLSLFFVLNSCEDNTVDEPVKLYSYDGVLTDADNNPVPNANITVVNNSSYTLSEEIITTDITDEEGNFSIKDLKNNLSSYTLKVEHSDYKDAKFPLVELAKNTTGGKIPVKLENDTECCGFAEFTIKDETGALVVGANVKVARGNKSVRITKTNEIGFSEVKNICDGEFWVRVAKDGYKVSEKEFKIENCDGVKMEIILTQNLTPPDTCCKGNAKLFLKDSTGANLMNAVVKFRKDGKVVEDGKTNQNGLVEIDSICEGKYSVLIELEGYKTIEVEVEIKCGETVEVNKTMTKKEECCKGNIRFFVKDADGNLLANALVKFRQNGSVIKDGKTNANGLKEFEGLCEGTYSVLVTLEGYKTIETEVTVKCNETIDVTRNMTLLDDCCKGNVIFWIKNINNEFIENATIYIKKNGVVVKQGKTNADGKLVFEGLCEGEYAVVILKDGYKGLESEVVIKCNETIEATRIITQETVCCKGQVIFSLVDTDGKPVSNATVKVWLNGKVVKELKTNADGLATDSLCEGTYGADFKAEGFKAMEGQFIVKCQEVVTVTKIMTKNTDCCKGAAKILVKNENGEVLKNTLVKFRLNGVVKAEGKTNADGYVTVDGLCEGTYSVLLSLDGYKSAELDVKIECNKLTEYTKVLAKNVDCCKGGIKLLVKNENGEVLKNTLVKFRLSGVVKAEGKTNADGYLAVDGLCEGTYSLLLSLDGYKVAEMEAKVECQKLTEYTKVLVKNDDLCCNNVIDITVKDKITETVISGAAVYVYYNGQLVKETTTNGNGRVELGNMCKGNYKVKIMKDGYNYEYQEFTLDCGSEKKLVFLMTK